MPRFVWSAALALIVSGGVATEGSANCPYRTMTPSGATYSGWAQESSLACVVAVDPGCPRCRPGHMHQCLGGSWIPLAAAPCEEPLTAAPPSALAQPGPDLSQFQNGTSANGCIYYDRDGRRLDLPPADLGWAEESGLVARKSCPPYGSRGMR